MKSYVYQPMKVLNLKGDISQFPEKTWVQGAQKLKAAHPVNYFPGFGGKK